MLALVAPRQRQILVGCLSRFLDESMKQDHPALLVDIEKHPRDSIPRQVCPHFIDAVTQWFADRHPYGPSKFNRLDVLADPFAVLRRRQLLESVPHGLSAGLRAIEDRRDSFALPFEGLSLRTQSRR